MEQLRQRLTDATKDMRLNLSNVLSGDGLDEKQRYTTALCCAYFLRCQPLVAAMVADAEGILDTDHIEDAKAAASIMAMNTVYYRTKHMIETPEYENFRPGLRMNRMVRPATSKLLFELCSMACAALAGCEACLQAHENSLIKEGLVATQIHESVRIAAAVNGFVTALSSETV